MSRVVFSLSAAPGMAEGLARCFEADLGELEAEEEGARDALTGAFEELKKFEHVAELSRLERLAAAERRESAAFDALGLRRRA